MSCIICVFININIKKISKRYVCADGIEITTIAIFIIIIRAHMNVLVFYQSENSRVTYQIMAPPILLTVEPSIIVIFGKQGY